MISGFLAFATDKTGRWVIGAGIFIALVWAWLMDHRRTLLKMERLRQEHASRKTQARIEERNHEKSIEVERARASAPSGVPHADELPEHLRSIIIGD